MLLITSNFIIFQALKRGIKVRMSRKEVLEKTGELISLRSIYKTYICIKLELICGDTRGGRRSSWEEEKNKSTKKK